MRYWFTIINHSEHNCDYNYSRVKVILNNTHPENIHNATFIIVAHLNSGDFVRKCTVNYSYCDLTALTIYGYKIITLIVDIEIS